MTSVPKPTNGAANATVPPWTARTGCGLDGRDLDAISDDGRAETVGRPRPKRATPTRPDTGHVERAAERRDRQRPARRRRQAPTRRCSADLRLLQLADVLRREIALAIELVDAPIVRGDRRSSAARARPASRAAATASWRCRRSATASRSARIVRRCASKRTRSSRATDATPRLIRPSARRSSACSSSAQVAAASALVDLDQPFPDAAGSATRCASSARSRSRSGLPGRSRLSRSASAFFSSSLFSCR